ncbi:MAG: class I SAM-dependent methyltransferase [Candidatus Cloacimonadales bacterium]
MQKRHKDRKRYFDEQCITTQKYVIPYINKYASTKNITVLEIGCGEGGNLLPFLQQNCQVVGVDLAKDKITNGKKYLSEYINNKQCILHDEDVFKIDSLGEFDLIFYRDVIEHIKDHNKLLTFTFQHLKSGGHVFIAFPPWQNPFGGHQQMLSSFLAKIPFLHLLQNSFYKKLMELNKERAEVIAELLDLQVSRVTVESFLELIKASDFTLKSLRLYFINPNYEVKFNLKPVVLTRLLANIPVLRNFLSTTCYAILRK